MVAGLKSLGLLPSTATRPPAVLSQAQQNGVVYLYERDIRAMIRWDLAHNIPTVLVLPPRMGAGTWHGQVNDELVTMLNRVGAYYGGVWTNPAPRDLLSPRGVYVDAVDGYLVRHTDRTHLYQPLGQELYAAGVITGLVTGS